MPGDKWQTLIERLRGTEYRFGLLTVNSTAHRIEFATGLTDSEAEAVESRLGFRFPSDLRAFLQAGLPCGSLFPDWRSGDSKELRNRMARPKQDILFGVEHKRLWLNAWGPRPATMRSALAMVSELVDAAPRMIPIFGHRMMPDESAGEGNPVFSIHQTDIIEYGVDLLHYLSNEFGTGGVLPVASAAKRVRFWSDIVDANV